MDHLAGRNEIRLSDVSGKEVLRMTATAPTQQINTSAPSQGIYFVQVINQEGVRI